MEQQRPQGLISLSAYRKIKHRCPHIHNVLVSLPPILPIGVNLRT